MSSPFRRTRPESGWANPTGCRTSFVFRAPLGPQEPDYFALLISRSRSIYNLTPPVRFAELDGLQLEHSRHFSDPVEG